MSLKRQLVGQVSVQRKILDQENGSISMAEQSIFIELVTTVTTADLSDDKAIIQAGKR